MSPIHILIWTNALIFQLCNATCIGGWLAGYGPTTSDDWAGQVFAIEVGMMIFGAGLLGNIYHDDELREIRRAAARNHKKKQQAVKEGGKDSEYSVDKVYMMPKNGLFQVVLFPHYLCEWVEWGGWWIIGGLSCTPARIFLLNEIAVMLPRASNGRQWYIEKFGKDAVGKRKAIIPGVL